MFKTRQDQQASGQRRKWRWGAVLAAISLVIFLVIFLNGQRQPAFLHPAQALKFFYILSAVLFILGLKGLSSPRYARRGMFLAEFGMILAVVGTLFHDEIVNYHGSASGCWLARWLGDRWGCGFP